MTDEGSGEKVYEIAEGEKIVYLIQKRRTRK